MPKDCFREISLETDKPGPYSTMARKFLLESDVAGRVTGSELIEMIVATKTAQDSCIFNASRDSPQGVTMRNFGNCGVECWNPAADPAIHGQFPERPPSACSPGKSSGHHQWLRAIGRCTRTWEWCTRGGERIRHIWFGATSEVKMLTDLTGKASPRKIGGGFGALREQSGSTADRQHLHIHRDKVIACTGYD